MTYPDRLPIDCWVIALDEPTHFIPEEDAPFIKQVRSTYLFDRNEHTYCCEMTPSYYLYHVNDEVIFTEAGEALPESEKEGICEQYESYGDPDSNRYMHTYIVDQIIEANEPFTVHHDGETGVSYDDTPYDEQIDSLLEYFQGNSVL